LLPHPAEAGSPAPITPGERSRRHEPDRRDQPTGPLDSLRGWRGRQFARRAGEGDKTYVDRYDASDLAMLVSILVLNVLDAFFTLRWLQIGGREANPLMNWLLEFGDLAFLVQKCLVVGLWLIVLTVHKNFRIAQIGLWSLLVLYTAILLYHLFLQAGLGANPRPLLPPA
jgi:hypothetical protein